VSAPSTTRPATKVAAINDAVRTRQGSRHENNRRRGGRSWLFAPLTDARCRVACDDSVSVPSHNPSSP
jgi:hypothetical protein